MRAVSSSATAGANASRVPSRLNFALCAGSILVLLGLFLVPAVAPALLRAEHWAADWRTAFLSDRLASSHARVAIIPVTEDSLAGLPYILPINRGYLADLVAAVDQAGALAIGLDFYFARDTEAPYDEKLTATLQSTRAKVVLGAFEDASRPAQLANQLRFIAKSGAAAGYIDLMPEAVRRPWLFLGEANSASGSRRANPPRRANSKASSACASSIASNTRPG